MKRFLKLFLAFAIFIGSIVIPINKSYASNDIKVLLDGKELVFDVPPQIIEGRTLLPLRAIFEALGLEVEWDDTTRVITGTAEGKEIILELDSKEAKVNGVNKTLDVPAKAINGRTLVPVRFIAESLDMNVVWNQESKTVKISKDDIIEWKYEGYEGTEPFKEYERKYINSVKSGETRYNGKNHEFGPDSRVLSDFNKQVKFSIDNSNSLELSYSENKISVEYKTTYYDINTILTNVYYNLKYKNIRIEENDTLYTNESNIITRDNEIYMGSIIQELKCYATGYDAMFGENAIIVKNPYYNMDLKYAKDNDNLFKDVLSKKEQEDKKIAEALKKELVANKNIPLKILDVDIDYNSIGTPEVTLGIKNLSNKTIKAYEMILYCYDDFNRPVNRFLGNSNRFDGISQDNNLVSGETQYDTWNLTLYDLTTQVKNAKVTNIVFTDGTNWKAK